MADQPGVLAPGAFPVRDPRKNEQSNGVVYNYPMFPEVGGLSSATKYPTQQPFRVEKPTNKRIGRPVADDI